MPSPSRHQGFSLIELALGLVIVATMLSALLVPLATQIDQRRTTETEKLLAEARDALIGFAIAQGRFPCPATAASSGVETFSAGNSATTGVCAQFRGYLPAVTLGLSPLDRDGYMIDGYGGDRNRLRYAVAQQVLPSGNQAFTSAGGIQALTIGGLSTATPAWLAICSEDSTSNTSCSTGVTLANKSAIVVVWSLGNNTTTTDAVTGRSPDETENLSIDDTNRVFVSRTRSDKTNEEFDDLLLWIAPNVLINRMVSAGRLP